MQEIFTELGPSKRTSLSLMTPARQVPLTTVPTPSTQYTSSIYKNQNKILMQNKASMKMCPT